MKSLIAGFGLLYLISGPAVADHYPCTTLACPTPVELVSLDDGKAYGLLLAAPPAACRRLRYRVESADHDLVGLTLTLQPGEMALVRMGSGFAKGPHTLLVQAEGCDLAPVLARQVTLRKRSPDHGWRATMIKAAASPDQAY